MSNEELVGRIAALEVIAMTALGLYLAHARDESDYQTDGILLASMWDALKSQAATLSTEARKHVLVYGNRLLDAVEKNCRR
jgi:hypothetical protein